MISKFLPVVAMGLLVAGQASAAGVAPASLTSIESTNGAIMVNHNGHMQPLLTKTSLLSKGDRVVVLKGGHATVTYADGCKVNLASGSMVAISQVSPCAGAGTAFQPVQGDMNVPYFGPTPIVGVVIGGVVVGSFVALGLGASGQFDSTPTPVSP